MARWVYRRPSFRSFLKKVRHKIAPPSVITPPPPIPAPLELGASIRRLIDDPLFSFKLVSAKVVSVRRLFLAEAVSVLRLSSGTAASYRKLSTGPAVSARLGTFDV